MRLPFDQEISRHRLNPIARTNDHRTLSSLFKKERILNLSTRLAIAALVIIPALAPMSARTDEMKGMAMPAKAVASPADKAYAASMSTMMMGVNAEPTGKPDKDFVLMMMPHHQGAIDMAKVELQYGTDPELRQLATAIVAAQEKEIAQMKDWLAKDGK
jgi:uncharacterized protein (DUF305 family)